jgi:hypothetical protein
VVFYNRERKELKERERQKQRYQLFARGQNLAPNAERQTPNSERRRSGTEPSAKAGDLALLPCLRIQFKTVKGRFEGTYLWLSDPDNYARLTGYVYPINAPNGPSFRNPGLEVLFPDDPLNR